MVPRNSLPVTSSSTSPSRAEDECEGEVRLRLCRIRQIAAAGVDDSDNIYLDLKHETLCRIPAAALHSDIGLSLLHAAHRGPQSIHKADVAATSQCLHIIECR